MKLFFFSMVSSSLACRTVVATELDSHHIKWVLRKPFPAVQLFGFFLWLLFFYLKGQKKRTKKNPNKKNKKRKSPARFYFYFYFLFSVNHCFLSKKNELKKKTENKTSKTKIKKKTQTKKKHHSKLRLGRSLPCYDKRRYVHGRRSGETGLTRIDHCCYQCLSLIIHYC